MKNHTVNTLNKDCVKNKCCYVVLYVLTFGCIYQAGNYGLSDRLINTNRRGEVRAAQAFRTDGNAAGATAQ